VERINEALGLVKSNLVVEYTKRILVVFTAFARRQNFANLDKIRVISGGNREKTGDIELPRWGDSGQGHEHVPSVPSVSRQYKGHIRPTCDGRVLRHVNDMYRKDVQVEDAEDMMHFVLVFCMSYMGTTLT